MDLLYPSAVFAPPPSFALRCPEGWEPVVMANALVAARDSASPEGFDVNVVVVVTRVVDDERDLDSLVEEMHERTRADLDGQLLDRGAVRLADLPARVAAWRLAPEGAELSLFQVEAVLLVESANPRLRHLVQIHGTAPEAYAEHYAPVFRAIVQSLAVA